MSRSIWKPFFVHSQVFNGSFANETVVQNRSTFITQAMLGRRFHIYNGIRWFLVEITPERVGHCLGEFAPTRKHPIHKKKKAIKK